MATQLEQEMSKAVASNPRIVADQAELACRQPALRTVDMANGEERKRMAALAMQNLNRLSQAEVKAKNASRCSIASSLRYYGRESYGSFLPLIHATPTNPTKAPPNRLPECD